ncbi:hypothetical protein UFOVP276_221 [uncultured Caudovirales phage]|uniref:Uncharacterized protein n=1 Tax=uncultured Caudovirales phage TaxID=2100421 RepID=A0A6J5LDN8_9CAUD|nr:hypothetical protein UFOVP127_115 [uncultured Caudovirales phage]CAB4135265.1 hypothetical protein UFOVP276_221 [uncultured Caudovirales phage]
MEKLTRKCLCGAETSNWRACPIKGCTIETVLCPECGGDENASVIMRQHIYGAHTNTIVSNNAMIAFRSRLLMRYYRVLPEGLDLGHMMGYLFLREPPHPELPVVLRGEILPDIELVQVFKWKPVEKGANWGGYYALLADEPKSDSPITPAELKI